MHSSTDLAKLEQLWPETHPPLPLLELKFPDDKESFRQWAQQIMLPILVGSFDMYSYRPRGNVFPIQSPVSIVVPTTDPEISEWQPVRVIDIEDYSELYNLVDFYTRHLRLSARRSDFAVSYLSGWDDPLFMKDVFIKAAEIHNDSEKDLMEDLIEAYDMLVPRVNPFGVSRAITFVKMAAHIIGKEPSELRWLDISSGWGDRLLAACFLDVEYEGYDPNSDLENIYHQMIDDWGTGKQRVHKLPFEDAQLSRESFDFVLTSPPYFDVEIYSEDEGQSINRYPRFNNWMVEFLFQSLRKAWDALKLNGVLILHLGDSKFVHISEPANLYIAEYLPGAEYLGLMGLSRGVEGKARPVWMWRKSSEATNNPFWRLDRLYPTLRYDLEGESYHYNALYTKLSPPMVTKSINIKDGRSFTLLDDSVLPGGTKQRALVRIIEEYDYIQEFIYAGPVTGMAHIALSYVCQLIGKKATCFLQSTTKTHPQAQVSRRYGGNIHLRQNKLRPIIDEAKNYAKKVSGLYVPFGGDELTFVDEYRYRLRQALKDVSEPERCWLAVGSGVIFKCLADIWPRTKFLAVVPGCSIWWDTYPIELRKRTVVYDVRELTGVPFGRASRCLPPRHLYATIPEYDGKIWQFVMKDGQSGDYIFNVGRR